MSFRKGAYATVWEHKAGSGNYHEGRISTSKKFQGEYHDDFSGFVRFIGKAKTKAESLPNERCRIKIGDCEVTNRYDKERQKEYVTYAIFDFDVIDKPSESAAEAAPPAQTPVTQEQLQTLLGLLQQPNNLTSILANNIITP